MHYENLNESLTGSGNAQLRGRNGSAESGTDRAGASQRAEVHTGSDLPQVDLLPALKLAESTLAAFYRILHAQGTTAMSDGPDNWVLKIIREAIATAEQK